MELEREEGFGVCRNKVLYSFPKTLLLLARTGRAAHDTQSTATLRWAMS